MKLLEIKGTDVFNLHTITRAADASGKERMVCNYELFVGPKNSLRIIFEGYAMSDNVNVTEKALYSTLCRKYNDRRIYLQGSLFLDGQFSNGVDKKSE